MASGKLQVSGEDRRGGSNGRGKQDLVWGAPGSPGTRLPQPQVPRDLGVAHAPAPASARLCGLWFSSSHPCQLLISVVSVGGWVQRGAGTAFAVPSLRAGPAASQMNVWDTGLPRKWASLPAALLGQGCLCG